jgi:8-oxo-dGTP diphosphatase
MTDFRGASVVLFDPEGHVLLIHEDYGDRRWGLPGGMIEADESPQDAARRETLEETGLEVEIGERIGHYEEDHGDHAHLIFVFAGVVVGGTLAPNDGEIAEVRWVDPEDMPRPPTTNQQAVGDALAGSVGVHRRVSPTSEHTNHD